MKKLSRKSLVAIALVVAIGASLAIGGTLAYFTDTTDTKENVFTMGNVAIDLTESSVADPAKGYIAGNETGTGYTYDNIMPGLSYAKKPVVTIDKDSQDCWLFVDIEFSRYVPIFQYLQNTVNGFDGMTLINKSIALTNAFLVGPNGDPFDNANWKIMNPGVVDEAYAAYNKDKEWPGTIHLLLGYQGSNPGTNGILKAEEQVTVFEAVKIPADLDETTAPLFFKYSESGTHAGEDKDPNQIKLNVQAYAIQADGLATLDDAYAAMFPAATPAP